MNTALKSIIGLTLIVLLGLIYFSTKENKEVTLEENSIQEEVLIEEEQTEEESTMEISLPLATMEEAGEFGPFGCNQYLNFHEVSVPASPQVLTAVYNQLFSLPYEVSGTDDKNIIASHENLNFNSVQIVEGQARVYLSGTVMGNHCADEVFRHQIEQAAFQFDTVNSIAVYVDNEIFDWCTLSDADPSESGCDLNPKPWIKEKPAS